MINKIFIVMISTNRSATSKTPMPMPMAGTANKNCKVMKPFELLCFRDVG